MPLKRKLIKIGSSRAVTIPPDWLKYYEDKRGEPVEDILMELDNIITISVEEGPKAEPEALFPKEEILLPYPKLPDTDDEGRLSVAAFAENYECIQEYVKREKPTWQTVGLSMETVMRTGKRFFRVTKIINTTP
jgi:hypothetical protein